MSESPFDRHNTPASFLASLNLRKSIPPALEAEFIAFKDIGCIDRIHASSWVGLGLTFCLFGVDVIRVYTDVFEESPYYRWLFYFHILGLLFLVPAIFLSRRKAWVKETRKRRGIVIWGMVVLIILFLFGQAILAFLDRDSQVVFLGYIFVFTWMFAMSSRERLLFAVFSITTMTIVIFFFKEGDELEKKVLYFIEVLFLTITAFVFDAFDFNLSLNNFLSRREIEREQERIRQLESFKSRFFTNLTHELRTPLTMISGMAREIAEDPLRWANEGTEIISRNAGNLLNLVNQILVLSKIESGSLPVYIVKGDVVSYLGYVVDAFKGHAHSRRIKLHFLSEEAELVMNYDPDKYLTILSNLLSNAIKFTPEEGNVYVNLSKRQKGDHAFLVLTIRDTGIGIAQDELEHIFERFYQVQNELTGAGIGTGIGLSLVHELVRLLEGEIQVKSIVGKGTTFTISLPVRTDELNGGSPILKEDIRSNVSYYLAPVVQDEKQVVEILEDRPDVLIIEDNPDVIRYLQVCLEDKFNITCCMDGVSGRDKAVEIVPDLIVSDVLMPLKDGLTVCRELKNHPVTNHIPIILLSAKVDLESRLAGLQSGADVYMVKPFEKNELRMQIHNLLERRQILHHKYLEDKQVTPAGTAGDSVSEDPFIIKARESVLDHLDESEFSVMHLCRAVYLSRTQLHKKLKALTGMSATQFIRHIRMTKARDFLKAGEMNVTEVAYQVGFTDPNYFTRCYGEEFGESPSETRNARKSS